VVSATLSDDFFSTGQTLDKKLHTICRYEWTCNTWQWV